MDNDSHDGIRISVEFGSPAQDDESPDAKILAETEKLQKKNPSVGGLFLDAIHTNRAAADEVLIALNSNGYGPYTLHVLSRDAMAALLLAAEGVSTWKQDDLIRNARRALKKQTGTAIDGPR